MTEITTVEYRSIKKPSKAKEKFYSLIYKLAESYGLKLENRFDDERRYRFDISIPSRMIAFEYEGGNWINGGHNRAAGYHANCQKYNLAQLRGWYVYRFTSDDFTKRNITATELFIKSVLD